MSAIGIASSLSFVACSDDDGGNGPEVGGGTANPSTVFTSGVPKTVGGMNITTNADGLVSKITDGNAVVTFDYAQSRADNQADVVMNVKNMDGDDHICYIYLNSDGYAGYVKELCTYEDGSYWNEYRLDYNADKQISKIRVSNDEGSDALNYEYSGGNITKMTGSLDGDSFAIISYGSSPIANKGGLMWFDLYGIEMDESIVFIYYAGMLGKATASLPQRCEIYDGGSTDVQTCNWTVGTDGLPTKMISTYTSSEDGWTDTQEYNFVW